MTALSDCPRISHLAGCLCGAGGHPGVVEMSDHFFKNHPRQNAGSLPDHANNEGELSALMVAHFRDAPTLQQAARQMLADALVRATPFPNPDALFIHRNNAAGSDPT